MPGRPWPLAGAVLALGLACGDPGEDAPPAGEPARVVLGTGESEFEPIDGEPLLPLVAGVQGGFHVWASFLVYGTTRDRLNMVLTTEVEDDPAKSLVMRARVALRDTLDEEGLPARSFAGFPAQVYDARCAQDKRVRVAIELSDGDGTPFGDTRHCIAQVAEQARRTDCP